jgi:hypothetical protein
MEKLAAPGTATTIIIENELNKMRASAAVVQKIRLSAQRELELAKKMRADAERYQQEVETKARSQAQQLILRTRLATRKEIDELLHKEIDELLHKANAEIQKMLADIRVMRITAQEELAAQRKFRDAARIYSLSPAPQEETIEIAGKKKRQLASKK